MFGINPALLKKEFQKASEPNDEAKAPNDEAKAPKLNLKQDLPTKLRDFRDYVSINVTVDSLLYKAEPARGDLTDGLKTGYEAPEKQVIAHEDYLAEVHRLGHLIRHQSTAFKVLQSWLNIQKF